MLERLLSSLDGLTFATSIRPEIEVVVVDNDADRSALDCVRRRTAVAAWPMRYVHEPRTGIAQARNAALAFCEGRHDFVAFVDDDEVVEPRWLDQLLATQAETRADAVAGPVVAEFDAGVSAWIARGRFFTRPRRATGEEIHAAGTGNVLIGMAAVGRLGLRFDERFGLSGGEDTHFFMRARRAGFRIVWADAARVRERVPASRANAAWLLRRAFREGNVFVACERDVLRSPWVNALRVLKAAAHVARGVALASPGLVLGRAVGLHGLREASLGAGMLSAIVGWRADEYRSVHGC